MEIKFDRKATLEKFNQIIEVEWAKSLNAKKLIFDFEKTEWISSKTLSLIFAWINHIRIIKPDCFIEVGIPSLSPMEGDTEDSRENRERRAASLIYTFDIKKSCNLFSNSLIGNTAINSSKFSNQDSNWRKIKPFETIDLKNFRDIKNIRKNLPEKVSEVFKEVLKRKEEIYNLLQDFNSHTPFENRTLSHLITVELLLNSAQHTKEDKCYFSVILNNKFTKEQTERKLKQKKAFEYSQSNNISYEEALKITQVEEKTINDRYEYSIDTLLKRNIENDWDEIVLNFFKKNPNDKLYKNISYLEFTFLDFGDGIPKTLKEKYLIEKDKEKIKRQLSKNHRQISNLDTKILEYAFLLSTSKNDFIENIEIQDFVPRGLYFLIDIVRRYRGLITINSKKGEIFYDFSKNYIANEAVIHSSSTREFPGTFINILIPEATNEDLTISAVNPDEKFYQQKHKDSIVVKEFIAKEYHPIYISVLDILNNAYLNSNDQIGVYNYLFNDLNNILDKYQEKNCIIYLDFAAVDISFITQKIFFYLTNTPKVNLKTNIVILNVTSRKLLEDAQSAIMKSEPFLFRPIPCIFYENNNKDIIWIGIKKIEDQHFLNTLLNSKEKVIDLKKVRHPEVDTLNGNFISVIWQEEDENFGKISIENSLPALKEIDFNNCIYAETELIKSIESPKSNQPQILLEKANTFFHTAGGYYQKKFLRFYDLLFYSADEGLNYSYRIAINLFNKWMFDNGTIPKVDFILSVTLSGQLLAKDILRRYIELVQRQNKLIEKNSAPELIRLSHYYEYKNEYGFKKITESSHVLIVTDVISSGGLINNLANSIEKRGAYVEAVFSIADCRIDKNNISSDEVPSIYNDEIDFKTTALVKYGIRKYKPEYVAKNKNAETEILRINPVLNIPISMNEEDSVLENSVLLRDFDNIIDKLDDKDLLVGYFKNNNAYHPYFFNTSKIFTKDSGIDLIKAVFKILNKRIEYNIDFVFFPLFSSIELIPEITFKEIIGNDKLKLYALPRIDTPKGWRFTFPPKILNPLTKDKNILIIDDGSCSGDTLLQMIDMISFLQVTNIAVLTIFCRIEDFQREFYSRLDGIKVKKLKTIYDEKLRPIEKRLKKANIDVFFGLQAFIPHYPFEKSSKFQEEYESLKKLSKIQLTELIRNYIKLRVEDLEFQDLQLSKSVKTLLPRYFPPNIKNSEVVKLRNKVGKLEGYRIYKQHFNEIISSDTKSIELLIGIVIHEPRLNVVLNHLTRDVYTPLFEKVKSSIFNNFNTEEFNYGWSPVSLIMFLNLYDESLLMNANNIPPIISSIIELEKNDPLMAKECIGYILFNWCNYLYEILPNSRKLQTLNLIHELFAIFRKSENQVLIESEFANELNKLHFLFHETNFDKNKIINAFQYLSLFFNKEDIKPNHAELSNTLSLLSDSYYDIYDGYEPDTKSIERYLRKLKRIMDEELLPNIFDLKQFVIKYCDSLNDVLFNETSFLQQYNSLIKKIENSLNAGIDNNNAENIFINIDRFQSEFLINPDFKSIFINKYPCAFFEVWEKAINQYLDLTYLEKVQLNSNSFPVWNSLVLIHEDVLLDIFKEIINNINHYFDEGLIQQIEFKYKADQEKDGEYCRFEIIENIKPQKNGNSGTGFQKIQHLLEPFNGEFRTTLNSKSEDFRLNFKLRIN
jgi:orotate phosphoribosyltransferase